MNYKKIIILIIIICLGLLILFLSNKDKMSKFSGNSESIDYINNYLETLETNLKEQNLDFKSEKTKNKTITSMLVTIQRQDEKEFLSYNIETSTGKILNNDEVVKSFGYSLDDIYNKIEEFLKKYYNDEVSSGYIDNQCDFNCYKIHYREIENIEDCYVLYVKDDKLYVYVNINETNDKEYFQNLENPYKIEM